MTWSTSYVRISAGAGQVYPKTLTYDTALIVGREHAYHPVKAYLENCAANVEPCPYFDTLATELLGVAEDTMTDVRMPDGKRLCDVILKRFLIGAVVASSILAASMTGCPSARWPERR